MKNRNPFIDDMSRGDTLQNVKCGLDLLVEANFGEYQSEETRIGRQLVYFALMEAVSYEIERDEQEREAKR